MDFDFMTAVKKRKVGNPNWKKGMKSPNPKGKSYGKEVINQTVVNALRHALDNAHENGAEGYFLDIAKKKPELFIGMIQKVMPNETKVEVTVDLGGAMEEAERRLQASRDSNLIDITPNDSD